MKDNLGKRLQQTVFGLINGADEALSSQLDCRKEAAKKRRSTSPRP